MKTHIKTIIKIGITLILIMSVLAGCGGKRRGPGPIDAFAFTAAKNSTLSQDVVGAISEKSDPKMIMLVVPPGTSVSNLVATVSLRTQAMISVISSGLPMVQMNGESANDFSVPVTYSVQVSGEDEPWNYRVTVREAETNPLLSGITFPDAGPLTPGFNPERKEYSVEVPYAAKDVKIQTQAQSSYLKSTTINGTVFRGNSSSATLPFASGDRIAISLLTLAEDGVSSAAYSVTVVRGEPDRNSFLGSLAIEGGTILPAFSPSRYEYGIQLPFEADSLMVKAIPQSNVAVASILSTDAATGAPAATSGDPANGATISFIAPEKQNVTLSVTAQDGSVREYKIEVLRTPPDDNNLLSFLSVGEVALTPFFIPEQGEYNATVLFATTAVRLLARPQSNYATVELSEIPAQGGMPTSLGYSGDPIAEEGAVVDFVKSDTLGVAVDVTAQDGGILRYTVNITRAPPDPNADLGSITVGDGVLTPNFSKRTASYKAILPAGIQSTKLAITTDSPVATVAATDAAFAGIKPANFIELPVDPAKVQNIMLVVTAEDGTQRIYSVSVSQEAARAGSSTASSTSTTTSNTGTSTGTATTTTEPEKVEKPKQSVTAVINKPVKQNASTSGNISASLLLSAKGMRVGDREMSQLTSASDQVGNVATATVRYYRTNQVVLLDTFPITVKSQGKTLSLTWQYRSSPMSLDSGQLLEVEVSIPTENGSYLYYTEAISPEQQLSLNVPFLLYGDDPRISWPALGTPVRVVGFVSAKEKAGKQSASSQKAMNDKGEYGMSIGLYDADNGASYGTETIWNKPGLPRGHVYGFPRGFMIPEGTAISYEILAKAKNEAEISSGGTVWIWTTRLNYVGGFMPVVLSINDALIE